VSQVDFESSSFTDLERQFYRRWGRESFEAAVQWWGGRKLPTGCERPDMKILEMGFSRIGDIVFDIAGDRLGDYLKTNSVHFLPSGSRITGEFRQLSKNNLPPSFCQSLHPPLKDRNPRYYSDSLPSVMIEGEKRLVLFSWHALRRIRERLHPDWKSYPGHVGMARTLHGLNGPHRYTLETLPYEGRVGPCLSLFRRLLPPTEFGDVDLAYSTLATLVEDDGSGRYIRQGYAPLAVDGPYALMRTFFPVGFRDTPEHRLFDQGILKPETNAILKADAERDNRGDVILPHDRYLAGAYHCNGIPQVILGSDPCFSCTVAAGCPGRVNDHRMERPHG
jgi:hypothetical protein